MRRGLSSLSLSFPLRASKLRESGGGGSGSLCVCVTNHLSLVCVFVGGPKTASRKGENANAEKKGSKNVFFVFLFFFFFPLLPSLIVVSSHPGYRRFSTRGGRRRRTIDGGLPCGADGDGDGGAAYMCCTEYGWRSYYGRVIIVHANTMPFVRRGSRDGVFVRFFQIFLLPFSLAHAVVVSLNTSPGRYRIAQKKRRCPAKRERAF